MLDIQSLDNPLIKQIVKLVNTSSYRKSEKKCVIYGLHLIEEAYKYGFLESILVDEAHNYKDLPKDVSIYKVSPKVLAKINLLEGKYDIVGVANFKTSNNDIYNEDCIVLDNVQDPGNLGTIIRSAKASGINNIVLTNGCVDSYNPKVLRSSQGAVFGVNIIDIDDITNFIKRFKGSIIATVPDAKNSLYDIDLRSTTAFVFGNEGSGISSNILNMIDTKVNIPMQNNTESINVAMAMAVCVFEQLRQRLNK
jgi:TrmH family RNA methyltransferase